MDSAMRSVMREGALAAGFKDVNCLECGRRLQTATSGSAEEDRRSAWRNNVKGREMMKRLAVLLGPRTP
jgi:hypothetical protein